MISIPISVGELVDKITILEIKKSHICDSDKLELVKTELMLLNDILTELNLDKDVLSVKDKLLDVNSELWDVEDKLRDFEREGQFDDEFVKYARSVYVLNDLRFECKNNINSLCDSHIKEVKSYKSY